VSGRWGKLAWTVALSRCYNMSILVFKPFEICELSLTADPNY